MGDKILLMDKGRIVQAGAPTDLLFKPANEFVSGFFEAQRMQLELHAVSLKDIWPYLSMNNNGENNLPEVDEDKTMWEALDILSSYKNMDIAVKNSSTGEVRRAGYNSLFTALGALKENR